MSYLDLFLFHHLRHSSVQVHPCQRITWILILNGRFGLALFTTNFCLIVIVAERLRDSKEHFCLAVGNKIFYVNAKMYFCREVVSHGDGRK